MRPALHALRRRDGDGRGDEEPKSFSRRRACEAAAVLPCEGKGIGKGGRGTWEAKRVSEDGRSKYQQPLDLSEEGCSTS